MLQQEEVLSVFLKVTTRLILPEFLKVTDSQVFPDQRKCQCYAPREQLLNSFPTGENFNIMHQGNQWNSFSALSQQEKTSYFNYNATVYLSYRGPQLIL